MKFAHLADVHLGAWSGHPDLKEYPQMAFEKAVNICISENVDFVLICGDFFDTSLPPVETIKFAAEKLKELNDNRINVYAIPGSHDFSPTGKTMLSVLESAGLIKIASKGEIADGKIKLKFIIDEKTGAAITGIVGRRMGLEKSYYENIIYEMPESDFKIFMLHSALAEYKPQHLKDMSALPISLLPKGFDYYAAGHVHEKFSDKNIFYPGPLFPTSFDEFLGDTGFFIFDGKNISYKSTKLRDSICLEFATDGKTAKQIESEAMKKIENIDIKEKIVLLRFEGIMNGNVHEIDFRKIEETAKNMGASIVKRSAGKLKSREFEEIKVSRLSASEIEKALVADHIGKIKFNGDEKETIFALMDALNNAKQEGENASAFKESLLKNAKSVLKIGD